MPKVAANFKAVDLMPLESAADKESAQAILHAILDRASQGDHAIKADKVAALRRNINNARSKNEVISIGWNMFLSGERLSSLDSKYQKRYA